MKPWQYILVDTENKFRQMLAGLEQATLIGMDTESGGPSLPKYKKGEILEGDFINLYHPATSLTGISLADIDANKAWYVPFGHYRGNASLHLLSELLDFLRKPTTAPVAIHNAKHELKALGMHRKPAHWQCTLVMAWVTGKYVPGKGLGLKDMTRHFLKWGMSSFGETTAGKSFNCLTPEEGLHYAIEDAIAAAQLYRGLDKLLDKLEVRQVYEHEMLYPELLAEVENTGLLLDEKHLEVLFDTLSERVKKHYRVWYANCPNRKVDGVWVDTVPEMHSPPTAWGKQKRKFPVCESGINPASPTQMQVFFQLGWWPTVGIEQTASGYSTNAASLELIKEHLEEGTQAYKCVDALLEIKLIEKMRTTFTRGLLVQQQDSQDRRLHGSLNQTGTKTGRLSSSGPNLQNLPAHSEIGKEIRKGIIAGEDYKLVVADYSSLEYRIGAHYAGKGYLWDCYQNDVDPHGATMQAYGVDRPTAKKLNFAGFYGGGIGQYTNILHVDRAEAKDIKADVDERFRHERKVMDAIQEAAVRRGWVKNWFGFKRWLPDAQKVCHRAGRGHNQWECETCSAIARAKRQASNMVMQSTGGSLTKRAMLAWRSKHNSVTAAILVQVHDEIVIRAAELSAGYIASELPRVMMQVGVDAGIKVPLVAEANIGDNWAEAK